MKTVECNYIVYNYIVCNNIMKFYRTFFILYGLFSECQTFSSTLIPSTTFSSHCEMINNSVCNIDDTFHFDPKKCCGCYETHNGVCDESNRQSQLKLFVLQILLPGLSVGCWLLGQYIFAIPMLILAIFNCFCSIITIKNRSWKRNVDGQKNTIYTCISYILIVLQIATLIMLGFNNLDDTFTSCFPISWDC